jgi:hypothetical protein
MGEKMGQKEEAELLTLRQKQLLGFQSKREEVTSGKYKAKDLLRTLNAAGLTTKPEKNGIHVLGHDGKPILDGLKQFSLPAQAEYHTEKQIGRYLDLAEYHLIGSVQKERQKLKKT